MAVVGMGVGGVAIATAQTDGDSPRAFFDAVARHLGISSEELEDATKAAAIEQVDAALEAGRITEEEAERLKERIESADGVPFFGPRFGFRGFHGGLRLHAPGGQLSAAADYLGLSVAELRERLRDGESLADVARAENKGVDGLEQALLDAVEKKLDEAVGDGDLTRAQADRIRERIESHIDDIVNGSVQEWRFHRFRGPPGEVPPAGAEFWGASV
jgi:ribosomal protein S20